VTPSRDRVDAGLRLLAWGMALAVLASLIATVANQWAWAPLKDGSYGGDLDAILETVRLIGWARTGVYVCTSAMLIVGCWMIASSPVPRVRGLAQLAAGAIVLHLACNVGLFVLETGDDLSERTFRAITLTAEAFSLAHVVLLGLVLRRLVVRGGGTISTLVVVIALGGLAWDVFAVVTDLVAPRWLYGDGNDWMVVYGISMAVTVSRAALVFAARGAIQRSATMSTSTDTGRGGDQHDGRPPLEGEGWTVAAEGLRLYRGALIARLVIVCVTLGLVGWALMTKNPGSLKGLGLILPLAELVAALVMLVGLVRYSSNLPVQVGATGAAVGGIICFVLAGLTQLYAYSIVWRLHSFQQKAERATSMWDMPSIGDLMDKAQSLPWIDLLATVTSLIGLLLVLTSLKTLARWLGERGLEGSANGLAVGMALLTIFAGGVRWYVATARRPSAGLILMLGLIAAIWALAMIVQYIGLLRELSQAMEAGRPTIPTARVTGGGTIGGSSAAPPATAPPASEPPPE
jgi:hypothetical protein